MEKTNGTNEQNQEDSNPEKGRFDDVLAEFTIKLVRVQTHISDPIVYMDMIYAKDGGYVGNLETAKRLFDRGIVPQLRDSNGSTCSIGKSFIDGKWYGWSHRAIYGFQIGDEVKEGHCTASSGLTDEYLKDHPEEDLSLPVGFIAKTDDDAKRMAIAFADSVS